MIATFNRKDEVLRTVGRVIALPEHPAIVVVDNGSMDGTAAALARYGRVEVVALNANVGAVARNIGVRTARTPYVAFCDDDTWWAPGALAQAADLLDAHPKLAVVNARVLVGPEEREDPTCVEMADSPLPADPTLPGAPVLGFLAGASMVRRAAFLEAGGFEPRFFLGGEEMLLAVDLAARGWSLCYVPALVVHHHPSPRRDARARRRLLLRNTLWFLWLRRPIPVAWRHTRRLLGLAWADKGSFLAFAQALAGCGWVWKHRRLPPMDVEARLARLRIGIRP